MVDVGLGCKGGQETYDGMHSEVKKKKKRICTTESQKAILKKKRIKKYIGNPILERSLDSILKLPSKFKKDYSSLDFNKVV